MRWLFLLFLVPNAFFVTLGRPNLLLQIEIFNKFIFNFLCSLAYVCANARQSAEEVNFEEDQLVHHARILPVDVESALELVQHGDRRRVSHAAGVRRRLPQVDHAAGRGADAGLHFGAARRPLGPAARPSPQHQHQRR